MKWLLTGFSHERAGGVRVDSNDAHHVSLTIDHTHMRLSVQEGFRVYRGRRSGVYKSKKQATLANRLLLISIRLTCYSGGSLR